ncbi:hypothetical protein ALO37_100933 [Pseudomonas savastanoi pv. glycinea]|nr:hypothetical protein ALO37_100933 [Pseudomonas savastanoi pv. glycinea]RMM91768.1 hypothetical protein ALQ68_101224 [Pseudomonas savastanoi pv. glycinea]
MTTYVLGRNKMALSDEQKAARLQDKLARLRTKNRGLETGQKIILGGMLLAEAKREPRVRQWVLELAASTVKRDVDVKRLAPLLDELASMAP